MGVSTKMIRWVQALCSNRLTWVTFDVEKSKTVILKQGVSQRSVLSPLLFLFYINDLQIYCGAVLVTEMVGVKIGKTGIKKVPWWKRGLKGQIKDIKRELSRVNAIKGNKPIKKKNLGTLQRKY